MAYIEHSFDSTCVSHIAYDDDSENLSLTFVKGGTYDYPDVSPETVKEFIVAPSAGQFYWANIRLQK